MAAVAKDKKADLQKKRRKGRPIRPQKNLAKQSKLPSGPRRNVCLIRLPKSCHLQSCPLMAWCFNKQMRDNVLSFRMAKHPLGSFWAAAYRRMTMQATGGQKKQGCTHTCPDFLKATIRDTDKRHSKRNGAPAAKTAKPRRRYSDEEIFYHLAKPPMLNDAHAGPSGTDPKALEAAAGVLAFRQPLAGTLQALVS